MLLSSQKQQRVVISHVDHIVQISPEGHTDIGFRQRSQQIKCFLFILFYDPAGIFNTAILLGKLNQTNNFIGSSRTFLHLQRCLLRPFIFRSIQCIQDRQRQLTFKHVITGRLTDFLAIKVVENIIFNLEADADIFTQQTGKSNFFFPHLYRQGSRLGTSSEKCRRFLRITSK